MLLAVAPTVIVVPIVAPVIIAPVIAVIIAIKLEISTVAVISIYISRELAVAQSIVVNHNIATLIKKSDKVNLAYDAGIPYLSASKETNGENLKITESNEAAEPVIATVKDILDGKYTNDLIKIKEFTFSKEEYTTGKFNYYANDGENKIMIYDKFSGIGGVSKLTEGEKYTLTGIYGVIFKNIPEVLPIKAVEKFEPTGITNITTDEAAKNAPVYNLAGQKVTKAYKGVVIKNGKKMIQK